VEGVDTERKVAQGKKKIGELRERQPEEVVRNQNNVDSDQKLEKKEGGRGGGDLVQREFEKIAPQPMSLRDKKRRAERLYHTMQKTIEETAYVRVGTLAGSKSEEFQTKGAKSGAEERKTKQMADQ